MCLGERPLKEPMDDEAGAHPMSNVWHIYRLSHEQKPPTFHDTGCLIGILITYNGFMIIIPT